MRPRRNRPLFLIDIALPRDVEAGGRRPRAGLPLQHRRPAGDRAGEPRAARRRRSRAPKAIVAEEVRKFDGVAHVARAPSRPSSRCASGSRRSGGPSSSGSSRSSPACRPEARARVDEITRLIVEKLLLTPTEQLKAIDDPDRVRAYADALTRLFALDAEDAPAADTGPNEAPRRAAGAGNR